MSNERTREALMSYLHGHAGEVLADDVVFTIMGTGQVAAGRAAVRQMLTDLYETAFDAEAELRNVVIDDGKAVAEYDFVGRHAGEFGGRAASGANVKVPFCVVYDIPEGKITAARVYFALDLLVQQIDAASADGART